MPEGNALEKAITQMMQQLQSVNLLYIRKIAMQIRKIGELSQGSINRLVAMAEMNADIGEITERLRRITAVNNRTLQKIFLRAMNETFTDPRFGRYLAKYPLKDAQRQRIERYVQAVYRQTAGSLANLSNTTAVTMRQTYIGAIDSAILAASTGVASYTEAMRDTLRQLGSAGMQVHYESGYHRRLDTAVRQNIVDGVNQINKNASIMIGEELGYDAIELSAHAMSAPDHEPVQGHVFLLAEFQRMQSGLSFTDTDGNRFAGFRRPIGEWNCRHTPMSFSTKWSVRKWTKRQLQEFIDENRKGCVINGKHRTLYEASQMMREIETEIRRQKDTAVAAQAAGDDALRQSCQRNINALVRRYAEIAKASGNAEKRERMTVEGFRRAKVPEDSEKVLTSGGGSGTISSRKQYLSDRLADKTLTTKLNPEKQNPHIFGTKEYNPESTKSYFVIPLDEIQKIVDLKHLAGIIYVSAKGQVKETIEIPDGVAFHIDENGINRGTTNRATIHYSKKRTHIVPSERVDDDE